MATVETKPDIGQFSGEYRFLSNFWQVDIPYGGAIYPSVEHAYQAAKTVNRIDRMRIRQASTSGETKRLGRQVTLRNNWDAIKFTIMHGLVKQKFSDPGELQDMLLATGDRKLIEGNWWGDTIWGVCKGIGENHLGYILMSVRNELRDFLSKK